MTLTCEKCGANKVDERKATLCFYHSYEIWLCRSCYLKWCRVHRLIVKKFKKEPYVLLEVLAISFAETKKDFEIWKELQRELKGA